MDTDLSMAITELAKGAVLRVVDGRGRGVAVFHGALWITQEDDLADAVIEDGDTFEITHRGVTLIQALEDSSLIVFESRSPTEIAVLA